MDMRIAILTVFKRKCIMKSRFQVIATAFWGFQIHHSNQDVHFPSPKGLWKDGNEQEMFQHSKSSILSLTKLVD